MKKYRITSAGQLSIPASVRRRWGTSSVAVEDLGDHLVVRPVPDDPIAAARGALRGRIRPSSELREIARRDDEQAERQRS